VEARSRESLEQKPRNPIGFISDERVRKLLAKRVQELRLSRGRTREDMRNHGFSYRHYQRIEGNMTPDNPDRLPNTFKVQLHDLVD
jgi:hypothetical protein